MPVTTRSQTDAANTLLSLRSSPRFASAVTPKASAEKRVQRSQRPQRKAAAIARVLIRLSAEALNQEE
jgi:hypothetical protein